MRIIIDINTDNAAFEDALDREVERLLKDIAEHVFREGIPDQRKLFDLNGNHVGFIRVEGD